MLPSAVLPAGNDNVAAGSATVSDDDGDYLSVTKLRQQYYNFLGVKTAEVDEARDARRYFHGSQWTAAEIAVLKKRHQPVVTSNRIERKINAVVGLVEKLRQDPKGYARTPMQEQGAELATAVLRYALDSNDWKSKSTRIARLAAIDGIAGIEYDIVKGDHGDPDIELHLVYQDTFFYDPRSYDEGFTDARYMGVAKWVDVELAKEIVPEKASEIDDLVETGSDMTTAADLDRERTWINVNEKRVRLIDHWYIRNGKWRWTLYVGNTVLKQGESPFVDEKGKSMPRFRVFSASVDQDGDRYGFIRNLKSPQDEINLRRSKALHILNTRRIIAEKGAFDDIEVARREWAKPDGIIEPNPGLKAEPDQSQLADFKGQLEMLQEAKGEIENFGPNPALVGQGLEDSSGRAISLLQQAGIAELGPYLSAYRNWKIRVYRDIWNIVQHTWTSERWIRVTDDQQVAQFFQINKLQVDQYGHPSIVNAIGSLDVDIILDEGPDEINMMADSYSVLQSLGPTFAQEFPEIAIELSPIQASVKKKMLDKLQQKQSQPPPPDQKAMAQAQGKQMELQAKSQDAVAQRDQQWREAVLKALTSIEVARVAAQKDTDSTNVSAQLETILNFTQMAHERQQSMDDRAHEANMARLNAQLAPEPAPAPAN